MKSNVRKAKGFGLRQERDPDVGIKKEEDVCDRPGKVQYAKKKSVI
jgi:hypothetical protein